MVSDRKTNDRITTWIRWLARGTGSLFAIAYLYLGITTGPAPPSLTEVAVVLTLVLGVLIAWWREGLGGLILALAAVVLFLIVGFVVAAEYPDQRSTLLQVFVVPYLVPGILFLICWYRSRKSGTLLSGA
jgi:ABC-type proline/glycine betaine transport system permease subunit